jgi:hypothetical protein
MPPLILVFDKSGIRPPHYHQPLLRGFDLQSQSE